MILETKTKAYSRVRQPTPKISHATVTTLTSKPPAPPKVLPKPSGKMYLYVYDNEGNPANAPQYYPNPHFTSQIAEQSDVPYPYAKEKDDREHRATPKAERRTGRQRVRDQGRKSDKAYKVLAEVTPHLRSSSRGGRMFVKQRQRMERFTKESPDHIPTEEEENRKKYYLQHALGVSDTWATPWNMATKCPTAVQYITNKRMAGPVRSTKGRDPLGFLPRPPDFWRAKVEQNFPNGPNKPLIRPRSRQGQYQPYMTPTQRPGSAPPAESPPMYENGPGPGNIYCEENNGYQSEYDALSRPASAALPSARIHFNAKNYYSTPHRRSGLRTGQVYTTTPYVQQDFNAKARGWNRNY